MEHDNAVESDATVVTEGGVIGDDAAVLHPEEAAHGEGITTGTEVAHEPAGMPQLDPSTFPNQIFWLVVTLVVIYFILTRVALPRIAAVLAERQGTITNDVAAAEELRAKATEVEAAYEKALADARTESQKISAEARAEVQAGVDAAIAKADTEIAARTAESEREIATIREGALADVRTVATDVARELATALGVEADEASVNGAVERRLGGRAA